MLMGRLQSHGLCLNITAAKTVWGDLEPVPFLKCESPISFRREVLALLLTLKNTCFQNPASVVLSSNSADFCFLVINRAFLSTSHSTASPMESFQGLKTYFLMSLKPNQKPDTLYQQWS